MSPHACRYEIQVEETLESWWAGWFSDMEIITPEERTCKGTILRGSLPDQAALFGLLGRVRDLNLTLVVVRRINQ